MLEFQSWASPQWVLHRASASDEERARRVQSGGLPWEKFVAQMPRHAASLAAVNVSRSPPEWMAGSVAQPGLAMPA